MTTSQEMTPLNRFLHALGIPERKLRTSGLQHCPMHPESVASLRAVHNPISPGEYHFHCSWPRCTFKPGSCIDLVMHKQQLSVYDALKSFGPGGRLANTLIATGTDEQDAANIIGMMYADIERQRELQDYLRLAHDALPGTKICGVIGNSHGIRPEMLSKLPSVGTVVHPVANLLPGLNMAKHRQNQYLLFPYSFGGVLSGLASYCPYISDYNLMDLSGQNSRIGIFMEDLLPWPVASLVVCFTELDAVGLRSRTDEVRSSLFNIVCLQSPAVLRLLPDLKIVTLVSHKGEPLTIGSALEYTRMHDNIQVFRPPADNLLLVTGNHMATMGDHSTPLWDWIGSQLINLYHSDGQDAVAQVLSAGALLDRDKERLLSALSLRKSVPEQLMYTVRKVVCSTKVRILGNLELRETEKGYWQYRPFVKQLTNFTLQVYRNTVDSRKRRILCARLKPDDPKIPTVQVELLTSVLSKPPHDIYNHIVDQVLGQGVRFTPIVDHPAGVVKLSQVISLFEHGELSDSARSIGIQRTTVEYPHLSVDTSMHKVTPCSIPKDHYVDVIQAYAAISNAELAGMAAMAELLSATDDGTRGFNLMLGHILHQTAATAANNTVYHLNHLILPSRVGGHSLWMHVLRQLYLLFSGIPSVPKVPGTVAAANKWLHKCLELVNLPLICQSLNQPNIVQLLVNADLPLVCVLDSNTAVNFNSVPGVSFLADDMLIFNLDNLPRQLPVQLLESARDNWVPALLDACRQYRENPEIRDSSELHAVLGYHMLCSTFDVKPVDMHDLVGRTYTKEAINTPEVFLSELACSVRSGQHVLLDSPSRLHHCERGHKEVIGCYTTGGNVVLLRAKSLGAMKHAVNAWFTAEQLDKEFTEREMVLQRDPGVERGHWVIPARVWERYAGKRIAPELKLKMVRQKTA